MKKEEQKECEIAGEGGWEEEWEAARRSKSMAQWTDDSRERT